METDASPKVTVLIATYNRADLLPRAVQSVLSQDFSDFEIIIIDDNSPDDTSLVVAGFSDSRIRYIRNETNQAGKHGDRAHVRRCIYELMRGRYFVYLCDDDYWLPKNLLSRQVEAFEGHPSLAMVLGGQAHIHLQIRDDVGIPGTFFTCQAVPQVSETAYHTHGLFTPGFMTKYEFLKQYAAAPMQRNQLDGATLFSRDALIRSKAFSTEEGSRWQAGYEFKVGPAAVGDVFYIDEPCVVAAMEAGNASYRGSQRQHFYDCLKSVDIACGNAAGALSAEDSEFMKVIRKVFIRQLTIGYLINRLAFKAGLFKKNPIDHTHMFEENVTIGVVSAVLFKNKIRISFGNLLVIILASMPVFIVKGVAFSLIALEKAIGRFVPIKKFVQRTASGLPSDHTKEA